MLSRHLQAQAEEPDGRGVPDAHQDGRKRRCRGGTTGHQGPFRGEPASWGCSERVARAILPPKARQRAVYLGNVGLNDDYNNAV
jgi:hypothetical protein